MKFIFAFIFLCISIKCYCLEEKITPQYCKMKIKNIDELKRKLDCEIHFLNTHLECIEHQLISNYDENRQKNIDNYHFLSGKITGYLEIQSHLNNIH